MQGDLILKMNFLINEVESFYKFIVTWKFLLWVASLCNLFYWFVVDFFFTEHVMNINWMSALCYKCLLYTVTYAYLCS